MNSLQLFADAIRQGGRMEGIQCVNYPNERGLAVYQNNYRGCLQEALASAYPVCRQLVGEACFTQLAKQFITQQPVYSINVHDYGAEFAAFLAHEPILPYLADMARFEWAYHCAYFAADQISQIMSQIATVSDWDQVTAQFHPSCHLLHSVYPISEIWQLHQEAEANWRALPFDNNQHYFLLYRPQQQVLIIDLPLAQFAWLDELKQGQSFEQASERVLAQYEEFDLAGTLQHWIIQGAITGLEISTST